LTCLLSFHVHHPPPSFLSFSLRLLFLCYFRVILYPPSFFLRLVPSGPCCLFFGALLVQASPVLASPFATFLALSPFLAGFPPVSLLLASFFAVVVVFLVLFSAAAFPFRTGFVPPPSPWCPYPAGAYTLPVFLRAPPLFSSADLPWCPLRLPVTGTPRASPVPASSFSIGTGPVVVVVSTSAGFRFP
jgi:hypothetical protein